MNPSSKATLISPRTLNAQVSQIKAAGINTVTPSTQGVPKVVSNVRATVKPNGSQRQVVVTFAQNANDPYFTTALVYLRLGSGQPSVVAQGSLSPLSFTVSKTKLPASIVVCSSGNWGSTPVDASPATGVNLN